jgi:hypothetical protein
VEGFIVSRSLQIKIASGVFLFLFYLLQKKTGRPL